MTLIFLLMTLSFAWFAYNLYHPIYEHPKLATFSFLSGWLTGELALHHIVWQVWLVTIFVWFGAVQGFWGGIGFLAAIYAWATMAYFYFSGDKAKSEMESALQTGLGHDYRGQIDPTLQERFPNRVNIEQLKRPWSIIDPQVEVVKNLPFGNHGQTLDIYRGRQGFENCPVLMQIHGGAWTEKMGSKNEQALPLMSHMALRGWICVSIDYRLSPKATFPEHIIDCKEALVWIKKHIQTYRGNPDFIVVTGGSAGGHLASLLALSPNDPFFQPGFEDEDTRVQGAVSFYGVYDFTDAHQRQKNTGLKHALESSVMKLPLQGNEDIYRQASPLFRINADAPPFLIIHGDSDSLVPVEEARDFARQLKACSASPVAYAEISGAQHAFDMFPSLRSENVKHGVEKYLGWLYTRYLKEVTANVS